MADIFISYKSERRKAAEHLAEILHCYGYSVWFDYSLLKGADFGFQIDAKIREAKAAVVLWCSEVGYLAVGRGGGRSCSDAWYTRAREDRGVRASGGLSPSRLSRLDRLGRRAPQTIDSTGFWMSWSRRQPARQTSISRRCEPMKKHGGVSARPR